MKVLTLTQPWATLVAIGAKKIETRSWETDYRGTLAIHAAKGYPNDAKELVRSNPYFRKALEAAGYNSANELPIGAILCTCHLAMIEPTEATELIPDFPERAFGYYDPKRFMWFLENVKRLPQPIPAKGALQLWEFDLEGAL